MATIKQTIATPIEIDPNKRPSIVDEANDGIKAVPVELVTKAADDSTFTQVSQDNPIPVTGNLQLTGSKVKLATEPFPTGKQGETLLEYDEATGETEVYKYISGDWRKL